MMTTVKEKYGFLPTSVWYLIKDKSLTNFINDDTAKGSHKTLTKSGEKTWKSPRESVSEFNPELAVRIIKYWSMNNDLIVDPFSGRVTRGIVAKKLQRNYIGFDVSPKVCAMVKERLNQEQQTLFVEAHFVKIYNSDGCKLSKIDNDSADMIFTCPPYWDIENYNELYNEDIKEQMSDIKDYNEFLEKIRECAVNCFRVLKSGKYCVWVVNDFRKNKVFYPFHSDIMKIFIEVGFKMWDIVINKLNSMSVLTMAQHEKMGYTAKVHEYVLVFRKD